MHLQIAAAVIEHQGEIVLVRQGVPFRRSATWELPGGGIEPGELPTEAMIREVREETGLEVLDPGTVLYVSSSVDPATDDRATVFVFQVTEWRGELTGPANPEDPVQEAAFFTLADAIQLLAAHPWPLTREPIVAHLRGEAPPGALWLYHLRAERLPHRVSIISVSGR
jgi:mutator protein MutT